MRIHLDFESFSETPIAEGLDRYTGGTFEVTLTALAFDDAEVLQWEGMPIRFLAALARCPSVNWHAFNAPFERACLAHYGIEVPLERWRCTMAHSYARGFSGGLGEVGGQVGISEGKLDTGARLIQKFAKPAPKNHKVRRHDRHTDPADWQEFMAYNIRDVISERQVWRYLDRYSWSTEEQRLWELDQRINRVGMPVDAEMARKAAELAEGFAEKYTSLVTQITDGIGPRQTAALLAWCAARGYDRPDLQANTIEEFLNGT